MEIYAVNLNPKYLKNKYFINSPDFKYLNVMSILQDTAINGNLEMIRMTP